ncbi:MAG TPA: AbrB/MazE/SpoVT family DNA-binding domain-containing protein [Azospirillaceae bacterium]|nr:AbrB/MazE/SpoVT family DNA-binding domain-containing protein [Azospirillaceae bacterium]
MRTEVSKWGNSLAIRLPRPIADELNLKEGTAVEIEASPEGLTVRPVVPRYSLDELLAGITPDNLPDETFDDPPRGAEMI